ncbi:uncharacterized protein LOC120118357 [Hibiscus syriacus]|uniref:uncharacterized protein LOC120118357 n=1 Tax=Hibiscus syriacus TaxID=106335 RepID=UPI0019245B7D|nr:uncharacterized protein LOC120118357 [Hibiscus syriacus]
MSRANFLKELLGVAFSDVVKGHLQRRDSKEEVKTVMFAQDSDKVPGPNGLRGFFQRLSLGVRVPLFLTGALEMLDITISWIRECVTTPFSISLNGGLVNFFKGTKGVRQGDPLFPYLVVITMNVLSNLLDKAAVHGVIQYHPKCHRVQLTNLCFADDLLVFSKGTDYALQAIHEITSIRGGKLPVRYPGLPLIAKRLFVKDCLPLSVQVKLPDMIIKRINQICSKFFWKGEDKPAKGARVGRSQVYSPKSEGELGLKNLKFWNQSCMIGLIPKLMFLSTDEALVMEDEDDETQYA